MVQGSRAEVQVHVDARLQAPLALDALGQFLQALGQIPVPLGEARIGRLQLLDIGTEVLLLGSISVS